MSWSGKSSVWSGLLEDPKTPCRESPSSPELSGRLPPGADSPMSAPSTTRTVKCAELNDWEEKALAASRRARSAGVAGSGGVGVGVWWTMWTEG
eukprot:164304-Hanusia_phi.AAC.1